MVELRCELSEWASRMAGTEREKLLRSIAAIDWPPPGLTPDEHDQRVFRITVDGFPRRVAALAAQSSGVQISVDHDGRLEWISLPREEAAA